MDLNGFNATEHEAPQDFSPIPNGDYVAAITASTEKQTKAGTGSYLELEFQILEGEHAGRRLWERLNLRNPNANAVEIANKRLGMICKAVNVLTPNDSAELHDVPLIVSVINKKRMDTGELRNEIAKFAAKSAAGVASPTVGTAGSAPPWAR